VQRGAMPSRIRLELLTPRFQAARRHVLRCEGAGFQAPLTEQTTADLEQLQAWTEFLRTHQLLNNAAPFCSSAGESRPVRELSMTIRSSSDGG